MMVSFVLSFFPRDVLDEILNLIESVSEDFPSYSSFKMKVWCVFSLKSPQRCNPNDYTQYTIFNIKKKITLNYSKSAAMRFFQGTQEQVRNSRGKRAISFRAIEVPSYIEILFDKHV